MPRKPRKQWLNEVDIQNNRSYFMLSMIRFLLQTVNPSNTFNLKIKSLLTSYPNVDIAALNFPSSWENEPLWK